MSMSPEGLIKELTNRLGEREYKHYPKAPGDIGCVMIDNNYIIYNYGDEWHVELEARVGKDYLTEYVTFDEAVEAIEDDINNQIRIVINHEVRAGRADKVLEIFAECFKPKGVANVS